MSSWVPLISDTDPLAARAWDAIHAISESILKRDYGERRPPLYEEALLFGYLAKAKNDQHWLELAVDRLNEAIEAAAPTTYCGLFGGLCGLGWTVDHLSQSLSESIPSDDSIEPADEQSGGSDVNGDIDTLLLRELQRGRWNGPLDLIGGLVGFGIYFLERLPAEKASLGVELLVYHLDKAAEQSGNQITWHTPPELLPPWQVVKSPDGLYHLGLAHGVPGILNFLSLANAAGIERDKTKRLLTGGMAWLIAQERPAGARSRFSSIAGDSADTPLVWCHGDPGIMAVLQQIAKRSCRQDWSDFANRIADSCLARSTDSLVMNDAHLCHGYAGIAHIFNRIHQGNEDSRFRAAALRCYEKVLEARQPAGGVGGFFTAKTPDPQTSAVVEAEPAFLDGAIGIALALLAAVTPVEPVWDRLLLLSGREA